jgi:hypothetical protein
MIFNPGGEVPLASWDYQSRNRYIEVRIRRSTLIAYLISLVIHGVVLFAFYPKQFVEATSVASALPKTMSVRLAGLPSKKSLAVTSHEAIKPNKPDVESQPKLPTPSVMAVEKSAIIASTPPTLKIPLAAENNAPTDLMSYINAKRQRSQELEDNAASENAAAIANARAPSTDELADANIKRNLQQQGTNGIFEIRQKTFRTGRFSFKGWKNDYSNPRLELIDVEAGADGDIDLAIVKKMIAIIRRDYSGDFNWESHRLGRVIVLSARMEDNTRLEEFLMQEFFSTHEFYPRS